MASVSAYIFLSTPFTYNPAMGNSPRNAAVGALSNSGSAYLDTNSGGGYFSRNYGGTVDDDYGLVTGFNVATGGVPEPATWALMLAGFGGLGAAMRLRRKLSGVRRQLI